MGRFSLSSRPVGYCWILDPGHGALTPGKRSPVWDDGSQLLEWEYNFDIVQRIAKELDTRGIEYHITVPDAEELGNFLAGRVARANTHKSKKKRIFVSIHGNAYSDPEVSGFEVFHVSNLGEQVAKVFHDHLTKVIDWEDRGIKAKDFYVLKNTLMPAILTENGFFTNPEECKRMLNPGFRQLVALAHVSAIEQIEEKGLWKY